jgi:hypothetical protein
MYNLSFLFHIFPVTYFILQRTSGDIPLAGEGGYFPIYTSQPSEGVVVTVVDHTNIIYDNKKHWNEKLPGEC